MGPGISGEELDLTKEGSSMVEEDEIVLVLDFSGFKSHLGTFSHSKNDIWHVRGVF